MCWISFYFFKNFFIAHLTGFNNFIIIAINNMKLVPFTEYDEFPLSSKK